jgi:hypothetical protein
MAAAPLLQTWYDGHPRMFSEQQELYTAKELPRRGSYVHIFTPPAPIVETRSQNTQTKASPLLWLHKKSYAATATKHLITLVLRSPRRIQRTL